MPVITVTSVLLVLGGAAGAGVWYFADRAKPGVALAGQDVQGQTGTELAAVVSTMAETFAMTFTAADGQPVQAKASELGVTFDHAATVDSAITGHNVTDAITLYNPWQPKNIPLVYSVDDAKLQQYLDSKLVAKDPDPVDATVAYDEAAGKFVVTPGALGHTVDIDQAKAAIAKAAGGEQDASFALDVKDVPPLISDAAAQTAAENANKALAVKLVFTSPKGSYQVPAATIASWIGFAPNSDGTLGLTYDETAATESLPATLSEKLAKPAIDGNSLTNAEGTVVAVVNTGADGTVVSEESGKKAVELSLAALKEGKDVSLAVETTVDKKQVILKKVPDNYDEPNGAKWIDIDLAKQTATTYLGTTKVKTYIIASGINTPDRRTDTGTWYVWLKVPVQTMRGEGYVTPNVRWISYFHGGEGFHAAPWVSNFGTPHSHGCINMKSAEAKEVYDWAPLGTMVKVHGKTPG